MHIMRGEDAEPGGEPFECPFLQHVARLVDFPEAALSSLRHVFKEMIEELPVSEQLKHRMLVGEVERAISDERIRGDVDSF